MTKKQIFLLTNKVRDGELGLVRGEGRGGGKGTGDRTLFEGTGDSTLFEGGA